MKKDKNFSLSLQKLIKKNDLKVFKPIIFDLTSSADKKKLKINFNIYIRT
jgi:hypothetical protein